MPTLVFLDGRREPVNYNAACKIKLVKEGATTLDGKPITDRQRAFAASVEQILFEPLKQAKSTRTASDPILKSLVNNPKLKGIDKFRAIHQHLKSRG